MQLFGDTRIPDRAWTKIFPCPATGCWLWTNALGPAGYARLSIPGKSRYQNQYHRVMYQTFVAEIPDGLVIDHLCRVRNCVNPHHLEPVTSKENTRRGELNADKRNATHCQNGHEYTEENTRLWSKETDWHDRRICKTCHRERARKYRQQGKQ